MRGSKRPLSERSKAVGLAYIKGVPAASHELGIPQRTLRHWKQDPELAEVGLSARADALPKLWVAIQAGIEEVYAGLIDPDERLRDKADALIGLMDKYALWSGEATARVETKSLTDGLPDDVKRQLAEWASGRLAALGEADRERPDSVESVAGGLGSTERGLR